MQRTKGLRFDRVAVWLIDDLRAHVASSAPCGVKVAVTCTAPIRVPGKTAAAIKVTIDALLERAPTKLRETAEELYGNRVRVRVVPDRAGGPAQFFGFVHNPDVDPEVLLKKGCS